jgi:Putative peptidoglycan binding domain
VEGGPPIRRRKWGLSIAATIIVLCLVSGGALMLKEAPIEIAQEAYRSAVAKSQEAYRSAVAKSQEAYRSAVAKIHRLATRENAGVETAARKDAAEKALAEEKALTAQAERKAAEEKALPEAAAKGQEAAKRQPAKDTPLKAEEAARHAPEDKPKSDADVRQLAQKAEAGLHLSEGDRKKVQVALIALGHDIPAVTGNFGPRTRAMITAWQKTQGLPETGYLTEDQLTTLRQQAAPSTPIRVDKMPRTEPPAPQAADAEVARLMARAERLLAQGDVGAARSLLERAAEAGSPLATFRLAESYDPTVLSTWGTVGTQGDAAKAQELYAKAAAGGVEAERRDRPR